MFDDSGIQRLLKSLLGGEASVRLFSQLHVEPQLVRPVSESVSRAELAQALNMALFADLLLRVPEGRAYVNDVVRDGARIVFDHGALRTVAWPSGALPVGEAALTRVLRPLGYEQAALYPLPKLKMTGRAWRHVDFPEQIAQFFVSELHPERFSAEFQAAVTRVLATSRDPLSVADLSLLEVLARDKALAWPQALSLFPKLVTCFDRQHSEPSLSDYELLLAESAEMAWIATEGNAFNHATDRVRDIEAVAQAQRERGRAIKDAIEVSATGRVRQTALKAAQVERRFLTPEGWVSKTVPGSFYEFIQRSELPQGGLDLAFDAGNATGIFGMTKS